MLTSNVAKAIMYLGSKGAGVEFFKEIQQRVNFDLIVTNQKNTLNVSAKTPLLMIKISENLIGYIFQYFFRARSMRKRLFQELLSKKISTIFLPMASPFDLKLILKSRKYGISVVFILHDSKRHPGDLWPLNLHIDQMISTADKLICLSNTVRDEILKKKIIHSNSIRTSPHPVINLQTSEIDEIKIENLPNEYILLIGRIRKYKNFENFIKAWQESGRKEKLVVAGAGKLRIRKSRFPSYRFINRWLTNDEIMKLIIGSKIVAFPYLEGSQSGIIPIVKEHRKIILVSELPGLLEQVSEYQNSYILEKDFTNLHSLSLKNMLEEPVNHGEDLIGNAENDWQQLAITIEEFTS